MTRRTAARTGRLPTRRDFLRATTTALGGLAIGCTFHRDDAAEQEGPPGSPEGFGLYVTIEPDDTITVTVPTPEIGQGVRTSLAMLVAEELEVPWERVAVRQGSTEAPFPRMSVGGSETVLTYWDTLREAGAAARHVLIAAAASRWQVPADECAAENGSVVHRASSRQASYAALAAAAATLPLPQDIPLKPADRWRRIGVATPDPELDAILTGRTQYGLDVRLPDQVFAVVERCPHDGGGVARMDASAARQVPGVLGIYEVPAFIHRGIRYGAVRPGVAVVAGNTWQAMEGRRRLQVEWAGQGSDVSQEALDADLRRTARRRPERLARSEGEPVDGGMRVEAEYLLPMLAHVTMEPMNFTVDARPDRCIAIGPTQDPVTLRAIIAAALELPRDSVSVTATRSGGGFGRRLAVDYGVEAALVSRLAGRPVQVVWSREDDVAFDYFRPPSAHHLTATLGIDGTIRSWRHHVATAGLLRHILGPDAEPAHRYDLGGAVDQPYHAQHMEIGHSLVDVPVQLGSWRSVAHSYNIFAVESFMDEIAAATSIDPLELRRRLLTPTDPISIILDYLGPERPLPIDRGRLLRVLEVAAEAAGWNTALPSGNGIRRGRGIACAHFKDACVAHVAEVSIVDNGVRVERIVAAVDCGTVVNPDGLRAQVQGAAMDGVASVLHWGITLENGRPRERDFSAYPLLTGNHVPHVEIILVPGERQPRGAGEPPYPSVAPAITNAIFAATGRRIRSLPLRSQLSEDLP